MQVTDSISVPGILEIEVQEYYDNPIAEVPEIHYGSDVDVDIIGENMVSPDSTIGYMVARSKVSEDKEWTITDNSNVKIEEIMNDGMICKVRVAPDATGTYTLHYGDYSLEVTIESQDYIVGPTKVSPYDICTYQANGVFSVDSSLVKILEQDGTQCKIEVLTGRKGKFTLTCTAADETVYTLPITIGSFTGDRDEKNLGIVS